MVGTNPKNHSTGWDLYTCIHYLLSDDTDLGDILKLLFCCLDTTDLNSFVVFYEVRIMDKAMNRSLYTYNEK